MSTTQEVKRLSSAKKAYIEVSALTVSDDGAGNEEKTKRVVLLSEADSWKHALDDAVGAFGPRHRLRLIRVVFCPSGHVTEHLEHVLGAKWYEVGRIPKDLDPSLE